MKRIIVFVVLVLGVVFAALVALTYRNTEIPRSECVLAKGIVSDISTGGVNDIVFELESKQHVFYINRGVEHGFDVEALEKQLLAEEVTIYYADGWTPFAPFGSKAKHIREIRNGNWIVYSEF
ncbi:hypothetical protein [Flavobacterium caeni]|nr:hypothetical protein [Flavobacterium caeni]